MRLIQDFVTTLQFLIQGLWVTISVTVIALAVGFVLGVLMAVLRVYGNRPLKALAAAYSVIVRAVPVVVTIFILYFVIASIVDLSAFLAGSLALGFASGAYQSEIFRGAHPVGGTRPDDGGARHRHEPGHGDPAHHPAAGDAPGIARLAQ